MNPVPAAPATSTNIATESLPDSRLNISIVLPRTYVITADGPADAAWWDRFRQVIERGHLLIQLRLKSLPEEALREVVVRATRLAHAKECRLMLNGPAAWVHPFGLAGLHLTSAKLMALTERPVPATLLVGASCHNVNELRQAKRIGADFACLAPVYRTATHAGQMPLGLEVFEEWARQCDLPVYALGGMGQQDIDADIEDVRRAGGQGIAGISAFWR